MTLENHIAVISLHFMYYNFCRIHQSLRITPAMAARVTERVSDVSDIVALLNASEVSQAHAKAIAIERSYEPKGPALGFEI